MARPWQGGPKAYHARYRQSPNGAFRRQMQRAKARGIEWLLTFEQWWNLWEPFWERRGKRRDSMVMARSGDKGPYAIGNVRICTARENHLESWEGRHQALR